MDQEKVLELIGVLTDIVAERQEIYFLQDTDKINELEERAEALEKKLIEWIDEEPRWRESS